MRFVLFGSAMLVGAVYLTAAMDFYRQERAVADSEFEAVDFDVSSRLRHPEAILGSLRRAFESGNYFDGIEPYLRIASFEAPSYYQSPFLLTVYRANRLEEPELVRHGFEASIRRFPANGRLRLTYARWLLAAKPSLEGERPPEYIRLALTNLEKAVALEEDLVQQGLVHVRWSGAPPEEWMELMPDSVTARRQLLQTLVQSGYRSEAVALLEEMLEVSGEPELFQLSSTWALQWGEPELALQAARGWQESEREGGRTGIQLARATLQVARAYLALGAQDSARRAVREVLEEMETQSRISRPARLELMNGMGYEYLRLGQTVLARSMFLKARSLAPYHADAWLGLARTYRREGDRKSAKEHYEKVLALDRNNVVARRELQGLLSSNEGL